MVRGRHAQLTEFTGNSTNALFGLTLGFGMGLGGKVVALHRPIAVNDYANSKQISHHYDLMVAAEGIHAVVAAPVVVNRTVRAVMYGAVRRSVALGDRTVDSVMQAARGLEQSLAVRDEVMRRLGTLNEPAETAGRSEGPTSPRWETRFARRTRNCGSSPSSSPTTSCATRSSECATNWPVPELPPPTPSAPFRHANWTCCPASRWGGPTRTWRMNWACGPRR